MKSKLVPLFVSIVVVLLLGAVTLQITQAQTATPAATTTAAATSSPIAATPSLTATAPITGTAVTPAPTVTRTPIVTPSATPPPIATVTGITRTITTTGIGSASTTPDQAVINIGVETNADTAAEALSQNNEQVQSLLDALTTAGVARADIQTTNVSLYPRYDQADGATPAVTGYTASNTVQVRVRNLNNLGSLLDASVRAGGNIINSVRFEVSDPSAQLTQARQAAVQDARQKADQLARLVNAQLGGVISITEHSGQAAPIFQDGLGGASAVPIEPGSQNIQVIVEVTWLMR